MSELDLLRDDIRELELEIEELENEEGIEADQQIFQESDDDDDDDKIDLNSIGEVDDLIYDLLKADTVIEPTDIIDGRRIIRSNELKELHDVQISKIQIENVLRFNSITTFPISNDPNRYLLGLRFDVFNNYLKKFTTCHYIILKQVEIEPNDDSNNKTQTETSTITSKEYYKWEIFQTTIPKYVPIEEIARTYLNLSHDINNKHQERGSIVGFNRINKFAMHVYEHLIIVEERKSLVLSLKEYFSQKRYRNRINVVFDLSVNKIDIIISQFGNDNNSSATLKLVVPQHYQCGGNKNSNTPPLQDAYVNTLDDVAYYRLNKLCVAIRKLPNLESICKAVQNCIDLLVL